MRKNEGYIIIKAETYEATHTHRYEIVLGYNPQAQNYVTWECTNGEDYFWGHYFITDEAALLDYYKRLASKYNPNEIPF